MTPMADIVERHSPPWECEDHGEACLLADGDKLFCAICQDWAAQQAEIERLRHDNEVSAAAVDSYMGTADQLARDLDRADKVIDAVRQDIAEAKATCGGDGEGCATMLKYAHHATRERRWAKCAHCPMDALTAMLKALAGYDSEAGG